MERDSIDTLNEFWWILVIATLMFTPIGGLISWFIIRHYDKKAWAKD